MFSNAVEWFCFVNLFSSQPLLTTCTGILMRCFMTFELDGENPPGVLSEVETSSCAPLNQCDTKSCSDGISMILQPHCLCTKWITINYNCPTQFQIIYYMNFVIICELDCM